MAREKIDTGTVTFETTEAIPLGAGVKLDAAGTVSLADLTEEIIGFAAEIGYASGQRIGVDMISKQGTFTGVAAGAIVKGAVIYGQNDGELDDSSAGSAKRVGRALEATTAKGDQFMFIVDRPG